MENIQHSIVLFVAAFVVTTLMVFPAIWLWSEYRDGVLEAEAAELREQAAQDRASAEVLPVLVAHRAAHVRELASELWRLSEDARFPGSAEALKHAAYDVAALHSDAPSPLDGVEVPLLELGGVEVAEFLGVTPTPLPRVNGGVRAEHRSAVMDADNAADALARVRKQHLASLVAFARARTAVREAAREVGVPEDTRDVIAVLLGGAPQ